MFLFNWKKIYEEAQGSSVAVLEIIEMVYYKKVPYNKYDSLYKYRDVNFSGDSFLLEPGILLEMSFRYDPKEVAVYIALAPNLINHIENNRLLYIKDGQIHFVYEEAQRRR